MITDAAIMQHEGMIRRFAGQLALNRDMVEDLQQEGRLAVFQALLNYDPKRGAESTYVSTCARGAMLHYLRDKAYMIRHPGWLQEQGVYSQAVSSLEMNSAAVHPADPNTNVERSALAQEELGRAISKAHLTPRQERELIVGVFTPTTQRSKSPGSIQVARRKLRQAAQHVETTRHTRPTVGGK